MKLSTVKLEHAVIEKTSISKSELLSMYTEAPTEELSLDEFELLALDRLQLLRDVENLKARGELNKLQSKDRNFFSNPNKRRDSISHFILRLAYCHTLDLRNWFLEQEVSLFNYRFERCNDFEKTDFLKRNGITFDKLSEEEFSRKIEKLAHASRSSVEDLRAKSPPFFRIDFTQCLRLVSDRLVYVEGGKAFVPFSNLASILQTRFRMELNRSLNEAARIFEACTEDDPRLFQLLKNLSKQYSGREVGKQTHSEALSASEVDSNEVNMPLCMRRLNRQLKQDHRLKHWGRLQYGLFLKGGGLSLEEAMIFWERHFTKTMGREDFVKGYSYSFRHMYGKEGARKNYTPYSCMKIIMGSPPAPNMPHGCPYKHASQAQLLALVSSLHLESQPSSPHPSAPSLSSQDVLRLASEGHFQLACSLHFDLAHPGHQSLMQMTESVSQHPNLWFAQSKRYQTLKGGGGGGKEGGGGGAGRSTGVKDEVKDGDGGGDRDKEEGQQESES